jgi:hypothetical protein
MLCYQSRSALDYKGTCTYCIIHPCVPSVCFCVRWFITYYTGQRLSMSWWKFGKAAEPAAAPEPEKPKKKICCACPDTKVTDATTVHYNELQVRYVLTHAVHAALLPMPCWPTHVVQLHSCICLPTSHCCISAASCHAAAKR